MTLTFEDMQSFVLKRSDPIDVSKWFGEGKTATVRAMSEAEYIAFQAEMQLAPDGTKRTDTLRALYVAGSLCDPNGELLLGLDKAEEVGRMDPKLVTVLFDEAMRVNGLDPNTGAKKNQTPTTTSGSITS